MTSFRRFFLKVHLYLGFTVGLLFVLMGLTGSLLVFSEEIDAALNPKLLHVPPRDTRAPLDEIAAAVEKTFPAERINRIKMPRSAGDVYEFWMNSTDGLRVYADPYTGEILGSRIYRQSFRGFVFFLHTEMLAGATGKTAIGSAAFLFLLLGVSGMILWWRGPRNVRRGLTIKFGSGWKRANFDAHSAIGFFAFFFLSISAFTGIHLVFNAPFEKVVNRLTGTPDRPPAPRSRPAGGTLRISLAAALERSDDVLPQAETTWIYPPATQNAPYMIRKKLSSEYHPNGKTFVYLDQFTGEVLRLENAEQAPPATRAINNLYPLHIGLIGGTATRFVQVAVGLTPAILLVTGLLIWRNRTRKKKARA